MKTSHFQMLVKTGVVFLISVSLLGQAEGILRPKGQEGQQQQSIESDRRQSIFPVASNPPRPPGPGAMPIPSRELLPPLVSPSGPIVSSFQPVVNQRQPPPPPQEEKLQLLPPVEIPPERPIDDVQQQLGPIPSEPAAFGNSGGVIREVAPPVLSNQLPSSSFIPTTGPGNSGGSISNRIPVPSRLPQNDGQQQSQTTPDPGLDCLGRCECPPDFNFVCGNNRYLYQNDCALECDKQCHPGLLQVSMDQCSRR